MATPSLNVNDVRLAEERTAGWVRRTPVVEVEPDAFAPAGRTWLKLELLQHTGSFKARGAFNRLLAATADGTMPETGVVAASGGNAGLAYAYAALRTRVPAQIFVPVTAPTVKVAGLRALGADVVQAGTRYAEAHEAAAKRAAETGALLVHAYDQPEVCAGQGTVALELLEQTGGQVDTVLVAVGGGGLMAGVATALEGGARVIAVEPREAPSLHEALRAGRPVDVPVGGVAADSLGATRAGEIALEVARRTGVISVLVEEDDIVAARRALWDRYRIVVEHGTATAAAALLCGAHRPEPGERVAVLLCGANTDPSDLV
jgi:threonine dehydratase